MATHEIDIDDLTPDERLELMERLWDSLSPSDAALTTQQRLEVDRRLDDLEAHPEDSIEWVDAQRRLRDRKP